MRLNAARVFARALSQMLPHLATFAVMLLLLAPQAGAFWECEGQQCGRNAWTCCCADPNDAKCVKAKAKAHFARGDHGAEVGACPLDCGCKMVVQDRVPHLSSASVAFVSPLLFVVPVIYAPSLQAPIYADPQRRQLPRGPPLWAITLAFTPLRGPPVA